MIREREERRQISVYQKKSSASSPLNPLMGSSKAIEQLRSDVQNFIDAGVKSILIQGETGTDKDALAKRIAYQMDPSPRFLSLDCLALVENLMENHLFGHLKGAYTGADSDQMGVFEAASGGFVFLEEAGEMPRSQQTKFLRVLQERTITRVGTYAAKPVNFRVIFATNVDPKEAVAERKFREVLYYLISRFVIRITTLRERREDIPMIIESFSFKTRKGEKLEFSIEALAVLKDYRWSGNIRQLNSFTESLAVMAEQPIVRPADIYRHAPEFAPMKNVLRRVVGTVGENLIESERKKFLIVLDQSGNIF